MREPSTRVTRTVVHMFDSRRVGRYLRGLVHDVIYSHSMSTWPGVKVLATAATVLLLAGCTSVTIATTPSPNATAIPTPTSTPEPSPSPTVRTSPFTGRPESAPAPVLIVKLDNTRNAQPHAGLSQADIVFVEEVEWGLNRLAAVFSSSVPERIGPVRSARISDIDLVAQFGEPAVAFSGAQQKLWPALEAASFIDVSANKGGTGYSRDRGRRAPYNYFADGTTLLERADGRESSSRDIGFVFAEQAPAGGRPATSVKANWPYAKMRFAYDPASGMYAVGMDGHEAMAEETNSPQQASTVIIQYVDQSDSGYGDRGGGHTPLLKTTGSGTGVVLRDGQAWDVLWSRPDEASGTTWTLGDGTPMPFKPGQQWIVLMNKKTPVKVFPEAASPSADRPSGSDESATGAPPSASAPARPATASAAPSASRS